MFSSSKKLGWSWLHTFCISAVGCLGLVCLAVLGRLVCCLAVFGGCLSCLRLAWWLASGGTPTAVVSGRDAGVFASDSLVKVPNALRASTALRAAGVFVLGDVVSGEGFPFGMF